jgi:hypothetical protein
VSGRVHEGPWSPPDPIKKIKIPDNLIFKSMFVLPIVLPIGPVIPLRCQSAQFSRPCALKEKVYSTSLSLWRKLSLLQAELLRLCTFSSEGFSSEGLSSPRLHSESSSQDWKAGQFSMSILVSGPFFQNTGIVWGHSQWTPSSSLLIWM